MESIAGEVGRELDRLRGISVDGSGDVAVKEAQLEQETKGLSFNEAYRTRFDPAPPKPPKKIDFRGRQVQVHRVNNHPLLFEAAAAVRSGKRPGNLLEVAYNLNPAVDHYPEIFDAYHQKYPALYNKMVEITRRMRATGFSSQSEAEQRAVITKEEQAQRDFYSSASYVAMATIARQIDPEYSLDRLC